MIDLQSLLEACELHELMSLDGAMNHAVDEI